MEPGERQIETMNVGLRIDYDEAKNALNRYVQHYNPEVNVLLRRGESCLDVELLDSLLRESPQPITVYRGLSNRFMNCNNTDYCDEAFISTSLDINTALFKFCLEPESALLIIDVPSGAKIIKVNDVIDDCNDEGEIILPRSSRMIIDSAIVYGQGGNNSMAKFESNYKPSERMNDFLTLNVYKAHIEL